MANAHGRQIEFPVRDEPQAVPRLTWLYALLALVVGIQEVVSLPFPGTYFGLGIVVSTAPALVAAALVFVAPRERLIQVSAACFALPVAVALLTDVVRSTGIASLGADTRDWANLGQWLAGLVHDVAAVTPLLTIVAVFALALYIGTVRTRTGWLIVGAGTVLALVSVGASIWNVFLLDQPDLHYTPPPELMIIPFVRLQIVAWSYLLAVVWERRYGWLSAAAAAQQLLALVVLANLLAFVARGADQYGQSTFADIFGLAGVAISAAYLVAMLLGILSELPRTDRRPASAQRVLSNAR